MHDLSAAAADARFWMIALAIVASIIYGFPALFAGLIAPVAFQDYRHRWTGEWCKAQRRSSGIESMCALACCIVFCSLIVRQWSGTPSWWPIGGDYPFIGAKAGTCARRATLHAIDAKQKREADALAVECSRMKAALTAYASSDIMDDALMGAIPHPLVVLSSATVRRAEYVTSYHLQGTSEGHGFMPGFMGGIAPISLVNTGTITPLMTEEGAVLLVQAGEKATRAYLPGRAAIRAIVDECRAPFQTLAQRNESSLHRPTHVAKIVPELAYDMIGVAQTISLDGLSEVDRIVAEAEARERTIHVQGYYRNQSEEGMMFVERLSFADAPETTYRFPAAVALEVARWTREWNAAALSSQIPSIPDDPVALALFRKEQ